MSGNISNSQNFQRFLQAIVTSGADYYEPRMGDKFEVGSPDIEVLSPKSVSENDNEESIALKLNYGNVRFTFPGDASRNDELKMLKSGFDLKADILHLGHHWSNTSSHPTFLKEVNPKVAVYSAGIANSYGHPHAEVVNLVKNSGILLYGTDVHGTIIVSTNGNDYKVLTKKDGTISPESNNNNSVNQQTPKSEPQQPIKGCININAASKEELQNIIHIGPSRAEELIRLRPFSSIEDLDRINGIGPSRIQDIKSQGLACVGG